MAINIDKSGLDTLCADLPLAANGDSFTAKVWVDESVTKDDDRKTKPKPAVA